jgi:type II secretory pathway pseudopilin PulG
LCGNERGETLLELLATIVVMGIAVTTIVGAIATSIHLSDVHRKQAVASSYVHAFAEAVETGVQSSTTAYQPCGSAAHYQSLYALPAGVAYTADVTGVSYWNDAAFAAPCTVASDHGVQQLSLRVRSNDGRATETLVIVVRRPCRSTVDFPTDGSCS